MSDRQHIASVLDAVRTALLARIEVKNSWGKNELKLEIEKAINDALLRFV